MFCENCGNKLKEGMKFCTRCGLKLSEIPQSETYAYQPVTPEKVVRYSPYVPKTNLLDKKKTLIIIGVGILVVLVIGIIATMNRQTTSDNTGAAETQKKSFKLPSLFSSKPEDLIIGKWELEENNEKMTLEFLKDGTYLVTTQRYGTESGKYRIIDDSRFEIIFTGYGSQVMNYTISRNELTIWEEGKKPETLYRIE